MHNSCSALCVLLLTNVCTRVQTAHHRTKAYTYQACLINPCVYWTCPNILLKLKFVLLRSVKEKVYCSSTWDCLGAMCWFPWFWYQEHQQISSPEFCKSQEVGIAESWYWRPELHCWTWYNIVEGVVEEIDHILLNTPWRIVHTAGLSSCSESQACCCISEASCQVKKNL